MNVKNAVFYEYKHPHLLQLKKQGEAFFSKQQNKKVKSSVRNAFLKSKKKNRHFFTTCENIDVSKKKKTINQNFSVFSKLE